jgi:hypothetical protein
MADYHKLSVREVTSLDHIGCGVSDNGEGERRICVALTGKAINSELDSEMVAENWVSLDEKCARHLYDLLEISLFPRGKK